MKLPSQLKQPSTYAGLGIVFGAIAQLIQADGNDPTSWAAIGMALVAIFKNEGNTN